MTRALASKTSEVIPDHSSRGPNPIVTRSSPFLLAELPEVLDVQEGLQRAAAVRPTAARPGERPAAGHAGPRGRGAGRGALPRLPNKGKPFFALRRVSSCYQTKYTVCACRCRPTKWPNLASTLRTGDFCGCVRLYRYPVRVSWAKRSGLAFWGFGTEGSGKRLDQGSDKLPITPE